MYWLNNLVIFSGKPIGLEEFLNQIVASDIWRGFYEVSKIWLHRF